MDNLGKIGRSLMDNWGEIRQLINILFCGYQRRSDIHQKCVLKPILVWGTVPQRVITFSSGGPMSSKQIHKPKQSYIYSPLGQTFCIFIWRKS
jgi:hypothetical protein